MLISFDKYKEFSYRVLNKINTNIPYKGILVPLKGGFFLSYFVSTKLKLPMYFVEISSYKEKEQRNIQVISEWPKLEKGSYLLIDDIYDSGKTVEYIRNFYKDVIFDVAVLVSRQKREDIIYGKLLKNEDWVDFWWEIL
jgi:hypoxanthine phosphoribosyltransferase